MAKSNTTSDDLRKMGMIEVSPGVYEKPSIKNIIVNPLIKPKDNPIVWKSDMEISLRPLSITLFGIPMPKQSVRQGMNYKTGKKVFYQPADKVKRILDYQKKIKEQLPQGFKMYERKVYITKMHFIYPPLKSFSKQKGMMERINNGELYEKTTMPDVSDNLKKLPLDAMSGLVYKDDGIICAEDNIRKYYGNGGMIIIEMKGI